MLRQGQIQQPLGIEIRALPSHRNMEMRAGSPARATAQADLLAALHLISFLHVELGKVEVEGKQSLAVVDDNAVPFEIQEARQQHRALVHGRNWGPGGNTEIKAEMRALRLAVEDSL